MAQHFDVSLQVRGTVSTREAGTDPGADPEANPAAFPVPLAIVGTLRDARTRHVLAGLRVSAHVLAPDREAPGRPGEIDDAADAASDADAILGEAITSEEGAFLFGDDGSPCWLVLREQVQRGPVPVSLRVHRDGARWLQSRHLLTSDGLVVDWLLPREAEHACDVDRAAWARAAAQLAEARIGAMPQLLRALRTNARNGPFAEWSEGERFAAIDELEREFLDPGGVLRAQFRQPPGFAALLADGALDAYVSAALAQSPDARTRFALADYAGKATSFHSLDEVDWHVDINAIAQGDIAGALTKFVDAYRPGIDLSVLGPILVMHDAQLARYRDYLRGIWISVAQIHEPMRGQKLDAQQAADQLTQRFHQDFHQNVTVSQSANELCADILEAILLADTGTRWGFGLAASSIPARGGKTARAYLDELIALSGVSAEELSLRYRIDFGRPDSARSSRVQENISTLQAFFRDGFQAAPDAFGVSPDVHGEPIVPSSLQGKAPFFLWYDEWLRQQAPFHAENHFDFRRAFPAPFSAEALAKAQSGLAGAIKPDDKAAWQLIVDTIIGAAALQAAHAHYYNRQYALAEAKLDEASSSLWRALTGKAGKAYDFKAALADRRTWKVARMSDLDGVPPPYGSNFTVEYKYLVGGIDWQTRDATRDRCAVRVYYWLLYALPLARADVALARGDHARAAFFQGQVTRFRTGVARESDSGGYRPHYLSSGLHQHLYHLGNRPYTADTSRHPDYPLQADSGVFYDTTTYSPIEQLQAELLPQAFHPIEIRAAKLRHANTLLEWADALYRTDEPSSIQRARELYKAVLYLHGARPPISSTGPKGDAGPGDPFWLEVPSFLNQNENPAIASQKARARAGFHKITQGLNWYGETDDVVPVLRYRELKEVSDRFAALAKATQQDFLAYTGKMEAAIVDRMRLANLIQKGGIQVKLSGEQRAIAEHGVKVAQAQVKDIEAAIEAKRKEIEDSEGFFNQLGDFLGGMVGAFKGLPGEATGFMASGAKGTFASGAGAGAMAGLGVLGGYAAFVYAGYTSMSAMADEYSSMRGQLSALRDKALPAALDQVAARRREVTIAGLLRDLAESDIALARDLLTFEERRYLSQEFWAELSRLMVRLLRRYLELAARTTWLAERALAYELDRDIAVVRFDYFPEALQGVTGADLLQADLAELEAIRVEGTARTVPARVTVSLAAQFPLAFGQLKKTGRCGFATTERWLRAMYPGTHGHRLRAVNATIVQEGTLAPVRGVLVNDGISLLDPDGTGARGLVRPAEALPISEFRLDRDLAVHGLPNEALFTFEGSGVETFWRLDLPASGNAASLSGVADVLVTFDLRAKYDPAMHAAHNAAAPAPVSRWILMSAQRFAPDAIKALVAGEAANVSFDIGAIGLSTAEQGRTVTNLGIAFVSTSSFDIAVDVHAETSAISAGTACIAGIAYSNHHPDPAAPPQPPMALNAFVGAPADQVFSVEVHPELNDDIDFSGLRDLLFAIEYTATVG
jgi:hypothetical protein